MTITLTPDLQAIVEEKMRSGQFANIHDVVQAGLRLLDDDDLAKFKDLRAAIAHGIDQANRGELAPLEPMQSLEKVLHRRSHAKSGDE